MSGQDTLFDFGTADRPAGPRRRRWGGSRSTEARKRVRAMLPAPCRSCGGIISPDDPESTWHAGHDQDRVETEALGLPEAEVFPEHAKCNTSAGGRVGAAMTNEAKQGPAKTQVSHEQREREPQWW